MARGGGGGPARELGERHRDRVLEVVGQATQPGSQHDGDLGHEVGAGAHDRLEGVEARGLIDRGDGRGRIRHQMMLAHAVAECGPPELRPGVDGRWPACFCGPDESTDTGMPVTSRRARPWTAQERRRDRGQKRPKRPALARGPLM